MHHTTYNPYVRTIQKACTTFHRILPFSVQGYLSYTDTRVRQTPESHAHAHAVAKPHVPLSFFPLHR